jgi:hypothetical protein
MAYWPIVLSLKLLLCQASKGPYPKIDRIKVDRALLRWGSQSSLTEHYVPPPLTGRRDGPAPSIPLFFAFQHKKGWNAKKGSLTYSYKGKNMLLQVRRCLFITTEGVPCKKRV